MKKQFITNKKKMNSCGVICGCDQKQEWLLPWFFEHYQKLNRFPITFFDFGMTDQGKNFCKTHGSYISLQEISNSSFNFNELPKEKIEELSSLCHLPYVKESHSSWMKKPIACMSSPYERSIWIDLDCKIKINLGPLFDFIDQKVEIALAKNREFIGSSLRLHGYLYPDEEHLNSGVIIFKKNSIAIQKWLELIQEKKFFKGDEEALSRAIYLNQIPYIELDPHYNYVFSEDGAQDAAIEHYCCCEGKMTILHQLFQNHQNELDRIDPCLVNKMQEYINLYLNRQN